MDRLPVRAPLAHAVMLGLCVTGLVACGGGGGGGGNVRNDPPPPTPSTPNPPVSPPVTPEPASIITAGGMKLTQLTSAPPNPLEHLRVTGTLDANYDGSDVWVGFFDSGAMRNPVLDQRVGWSAGSDLVDRSSNDYSVDDVNGHGSAVAQMVVGRPTAGWRGGVAPDANLTVMRIVPDKPVVGNPFGQPSVEAGLGALERGLAAKSYFTRAVGFSWDGDFAWQDPAITQRLVDAFSAYVAHSAGSPSYDGLVVFAAGDGGAANPSQMAALPSQPGVPTGALEENWITVAAVETARPDRLATYSNACGVAKNYCMVAPGDVVVTGKDDTVGTTTYWSASSTHMASPQVLGATAVVWEVFPYLDAHQVRQILLGTAKDLGSPGVDEVFGWGLLNVRNAVRGPARLEWGDFEAIIPADVHSSWWNDISGPGGLVIGSNDDAVDGSHDASLAIRGTNTFSGGLKVGPGVSVSVNGSMTSAITVEPGGYLYAWEVTLHGPVLNRGVMQVNSAKYVNVQTFLEGNVVNEGIFFNRENANTTLLGNLDLKPEGQFWTILGNEPLRVKGEVRVDGTLHIYALAEGYVARDRTEILIGEGGIIGQFAMATSRPLIDATVGYDANTVWLDVERVDARAVAGVTYTAASRGAAQRVESAFDQLDVVLGDPSADVQARDLFADSAGTLQGARTPADVQRSLESLSGELHTADTDFALMTIEGNRRALESRVDALQHAPLGGTWSGDLSSQRAVAGFDIDATGWMMGQDRRIGRVTYGAALAQTDGYAHHDLRYDRERNRQLEAQLYASYDLGRGYLMGSLALGNMQRWTQREVLLGSDAFRVRSDYAQRYATVGVQAGVPLAFGQSGRVTPYAGVQSLQLERDGFSEHGAAGFGLTTADSSMRLDQALLGARWTSGWQTDRATWSLQGRVEWQHLLSQSGGAIDARFTGIDVWSPIVGNLLDRNVGVFGLGLGATLRGGSRLGFDLDTRHDQGETWTSATLNWSNAF